MIIKSKKILPCEVEMVEFHVWPWNSICKPGKERQNITSNPGEC